jgi:hypothetical protein
MTDNLHVRPCEKDEPMNRDWEWQAQQAAQLHLDACRDAYYHQDEHSLDVLCDECVPDVASAPFDDCTTCVVRETLHAAWPVLAEMAVAEYLSLPAGGTPSWRR